MRFVWKSPLAVSLGVVCTMALVGCSWQPDDAWTSKTTPTPERHQTQTTALPSDLPKESDVPAVEATVGMLKTDEQIQAEIKDKLGRLTHPQGYILPTDGAQQVEGVTTTAEVTERLRKKGYALDLANLLTTAFYQERNGAVTIIPRDDQAGGFDPAQEAGFARKNKFIWTVTQQQLEDASTGPYTATYEVEVLKDGSYRLNDWKVSEINSHSKESMVH